MKIMTIKFKEEEEQEDLINFLKNGKCEFELPKFFTIPKGDRAMSSRARILLLAGLESLKEKYPKNDNLDILQKNDSDQEKIIIKREENLKQSGWI